MRSTHFAMAIALGLLVTSAPGAMATRAPAEHTVIMDGTQFDPPELTVYVGDTVIWVNKDPFPHTATSKAGGFDSGDVAPDQSWTYNTSKKGEFSYLCTLHPTMKGTLLVK
jgi:plastocyanin